ncbi:carbohydrate-binding protein [Hymenobacter sp. NST-14]|uniref:carbohydrate-binding protein n=1 Tax=Hymenobacter piscis TaxID=2839984 RepID=UPI001C038F92|nr:carbohydrate-binding protein [Hymenobacter piscis]MBT9393172.1 carbohydrate-binding protein [Hymenobacter piscis]
MNKLYAYGLGAALLLGGTTATAQNRAAGPAYELGSTQTLVRQLENQVAADLARRQPKPRVTLQVAANKTFTGQVNYREDLAAAGEYLVGELAGVPNSSFFVRVEGNQVEGHIILRNTRQAYRYSADARGNAQVQQVDIDKVICIDYNQPLGYQYPAPPSAGTAQRAAVVSLQSLPGARGCIMLDLDGQYVAGTPWNNGNPINAAPSGIENDAAKVQAFWELVSEDFRPFSINVTTDEAVFNSYPKNMRMRCIVTPTNTAAPGAGGVAYLTSFRGNDDTPCWVFMNDPKAGGEAASHEVGHTLGLSHDGRLNPNEEYYTAQDNAGAWAPIMGAGYYKPVTQWSRGEYNRASQTQDDLAIIASTTYNVGYRADDHGNSTNSATALARSGTSLTGKGIIERTSDQDYFSFTTGGGAVSFNVNTVGRYGNLDIVARLFDGRGTQIGTFDAAGGGNLNVTVNASLGAGTYYLQIDGTSSGNPATDGYSDYGSLGTFTITGTAPAGGTNSGVATLYKDCNYTGTAVALPPGDYPLSALLSRGLLNDDLSSLRVSSGYEAVLYENDNFTGASLLVTSAGNACLVGNPLGTDNWNDKTTSLRVRAASTATFSRLLEAEAATLNNGMTVEACSEGGQNMGYVDAGDYLVWNAISFPTSGAYLLEYRMASGTGGGTISADLNAGSTQLGSTSVGGTGGWQNWTTVSRTVNLTAGTYNFGIYAQTGGWNLNWVRITKVSTAAVAAPDSPMAAPVASAGLLAPTELLLYPNPVSDRLTVRAPADFAGGQVRILNIVGQQVWQGRYQPDQAIDVAALPPGVYVLRVTGPNESTISRRFLK